MYLGFEQLFFDEGLEVKIAFPALLPLTGS